MIKLIHPSNTLHKECVLFMLDTLTRTLLYQPAPYIKSLPMIAKWIILLLQETSNKDVTSAFTNACFRAIPPLEEADVSKQIHWSIDHEKYTVLTLGLWNFALQQNVALALPALLEHGKLWMPIVYYAPQTAVQFLKQIYLATKYIYNCSRLIIVGNAPI